MLLYGTMEIFGGLLLTHGLEEGSEWGKLADFEPLTTFSEMPNSSLYPGANQFYGLVLFSFIMAQFERKFGVFNSLDACSFVVNVYDEGNVLSIVTDSSPHGTHVAGIATAFHPKTRKRVLINAFTVRPLLDTFSPARGAGLTALCATSSYYDATEIATRILPNVAVLTIDPDSDVRLKAFQAAEQYLQLVKQFHEKASTGDGTVNSSGGITSVPGNGSLIGWAMSSLTLKGKPLEQAPLAQSTSSVDLTSTISSDSPGVGKELARSRLPSVAEDCKLEHV